jgi:hypothetical protein
VSIRDLLDQGQPDPAHPATVWGQAVSDRTDTVVAVMLWNDVAEQYEDGSGGTARPDAYVVYWRGGPDPVGLDVGFDESRDEWHTVDVSVPTVPSVSINEGASSSGEQGTTLQLTVFVTGSPTPTLSWQSSDEQVVTVDQFGLVSRVDEGTATITVTATNSEGQDTDTHTATVTAVAANPPTADVIEAEPESSTSILVTILTPGENWTSRTWHMSETQGFTPDGSNEISGGAGSALVTGLDPDTTYYFRTVLTNSAGSTASNEASATTDPQVGSLVLHDEFVNSGGSQLNVNGRTPVPVNTLARTWTSTSVINPSTSHILGPILVYDISPHAADKEIELVMEHGETAQVPLIIIRGIEPAGGDMTIVRDNSLQLQLRPADIRLSDAGGGGSISGTTVSISKQLGVQLTWRIIDQGGNISIWLNGDEVLPPFATSAKAGQPWVGIYGSGGSTAPKLYDFKVRSL